MLRPLCFPRGQWAQHCVLGTVPWPEHLPGAPPLRPGTHGVRGSRAQLILTQQDGNSDFTFRETEAQGSTGQLKATRWVGRGLASSWGVKHAVFLLLSWAQRVAHQGSSA